MVQNPGVKGYEVILNRKPGEVGQVWYKIPPEKRSQNLGEILYSYRRARQISIGIDWRSQWKFEIWDGRPIKYWMKRGYEFHSIFGFRPPETVPYSP